MTRPGDTVFVVVVEREGNRPSVGVFASPKGAHAMINAAIDDALPRFQYGFVEPDPGPEDAEARQFWWNVQTGEHVVEDQMFISYSEEVIED